MQDNSILPLFSVQEETREIPLSKGKVAIVDAADYEWLNQWQWHAHKSRTQWYAVRNEIIGNKPCIVRMHRIIIDAPDGVIVDHINRVSLDNRRCNLRLSTHRENLYNSDWFEDLESHIRATGSIQKRHGKWTVTITVSRLDNQATADKVRQELLGLAKQKISK